MRGEGGSGCIWRLRSGEDAGGATEEERLATDRLLAAEVVARDVGDECGDP